MKLFENSKLVIPRDAITVDVTWIGSTDRTNSQSYTVTHNFNTYKLQADGFYIYSPSDIRQFKNHYGRYDASSNLYNYGYACTYDTPNSATFYVFGAGSSNATLRLMLYTI